MEPPVTSSPPKAFTPRRCALESRPFFELPRPFLCAILHLCQNLAHFDLRVVLPVADGPLVLFLALELEHNHFVTAAMACDGALHASIRERGAGNQLVRIVHHGEDSAELDLCAHVARERFHFDDVAGSDAVLFSTGFNHCVHNYPSLSFEMWASRTDPNQGTVEARGANLNNTANSWLFANEGSRRCTMKVPASTQEDCHAVGGRIAVFLSSL